MKVFGLDLQVACIVMMERSSRTLKEKRIRNNFIRCLKSPQVADMVRKTKVIGIVTVVWNKQEKIE